MRDADDSKCGKIIIASVGAIRTAPSMAWRAGPPSPRPPGGRRGMRGGAEGAASMMCRGRRRRAKQRRKRHGIPPRKSPRKRPLEQRRTSGGKGTAFPNAALFSQTTIIFRGGVNAELAPPASAGKCWHVGRDASRPPQLRMAQMGSFGGTAARPAGWFNCLVRQ